MFNPACSEHRQRVIAVPPPSPGTRAFRQGLLLERKALCWSKQIDLVTAAFLTCLSHYSFPLLSLPAFTNQLLFQRRLLFSSRCAQVLSQSSIFRNHGNRTIKSSKSEELGPQPEKPGSAKQLLCSQHLAHRQPCWSSHWCSRAAGPRGDGSPSRLHTTRIFLPLPLNSEMSSIRMTSSLNGKCYFLLLIFFRKPSAVTGFRTLWNHSTLFHPI